MKTTFIGVVTHAEHKGLEQLLEICAFRGVHRACCCCSTPVGTVPAGDGFTAGRKLQLHLTGGCHHETAAIEHQLVVAADLVHINHGAIKTVGGAGGQLMADRCFGSAEGGRGEVRQHIHFLWDEVGDRIRSHQALGLKCVLNPEVFADGEP